DPLVGVDEETAVAEYARGKRGDRNEGRLAGAHQRDVVRQRHFRDFELVELQHAPKNIGRLRGDVIELDALGLDRSVAQGQRAVVGAARKCQTQLAHRLLLAGHHQNCLKQESARAAKSVCSLPRLGGRVWGGGAWKGSITLCAPSLSLPPHAGEGTMWHGPS